MDGQSRRPQIELLVPPDENGYKKTLAGIISTRVLL
jgi:hypothetical protein